MAKHLWQPGQSANPNGRPPKNRALTEILEKAGCKYVTDKEGEKLARKTLLAELAWSIVTTGEAKFPDGTVLRLDPGNWFDTVKWIYNHIDGPPKQKIEHSGDAENPVYIVTGDDLHEAIKRAKGDNSNS